MTDLMPAPALDRYLKSFVSDLQGTPEITPLTGGASNLTYRLSYANRELVIRRPPPGTKASGAHDMGREYRILKALGDQDFPVPHVELFCDDPEVIGCPFFVMEFVEGVVPRREWPDQCALGARGTEAVCQQFVVTWQKLHSLDIGELGLGALDRGPGYTARQIAGWSKRYRNARTPDAPDFESVMTWLDERQPADQGHCLIHNDYRLDNMVLDPADCSQIRGVLDWELATIGCPLMDLGASLAYWIEAGDDPLFHQLRRQPSHAEGMWTRHQIMEKYSRLAGVDGVLPPFYEVYGLFRLAGIAQQIYYRYYHGQFKTEEAAGFIHGVRLLEKRCLDLM